MRAFVIFATLTAVALARPDIGLKLREQGYNYQTPGIGGGASSGSQSSGGSFGGASTGSYNGGGSSNGGGSQSYNGGSSSGGFSAGGSSNQGFNGGGLSNGGSSNGGFNGGGSTDGFSSNGFANSGSTDGEIDVRNNFAGNGASSFGGSSSGGFGSGSYTGGDVTQGQSQVIDLSGGSGGGNVVYRPVVKIGEPQITKHFYVHEAPEEEEHVNVQEKEINVRPQKHYKIIFIKAPSGSNAIGGSSAPVFPQNEEKTIVYVLSKKNEAQEAGGEYATPPPPVTSKPEVFFIKYKTKQDADQAVSKIQESYQEGGPGYNSPGSFADNFESSAGASAGSSSGGQSNYRGTDSGSNNFGTQPSFGGSEPSFGGSQPSFGGSQASSGASSFGGSQPAFGGSQGGFGSNPSNDLGSSSFNAVSSGASTFGDGSTQQHTATFQSSGGFVNGGDHSIQPQQMVEIKVEDSAFKSQYLPPNGK